MTGRLERLLADALREAGTTVEPSDDLFARIQLGIGDDQVRRQLLRRGVKLAGVIVAAMSTLAIALIYRPLIQGEGDFVMDWWILELLAFAVLVAIALILGPFIKRFGRSYAADVFRSNPSTGRSFIVLTDFAYYLIFSAYILFSTKIDRPFGWSQTVGAEQVEHSIVRLGGILLIIGLLHGVNLLVLPIIGRLLTLNRRLDQQMREVAARDSSDQDFDQPERN